MDFEKVKEIIVDSLSCDESQVTMEANLKDDLEADSLDAVEVIMALEDKYDLVVAHRISEPGSITKQIITEIYSAKLVVANLTNRNPNVMYELALRHSLGKPVIMIAEKGTPLPSDIVMERTIFYQNDARGVIELRENIAEAEKEKNK